VAKTWVLETGTKGTGANVRPLETVVEPEPASKPARKPSTKRPEASESSRRAERRHARTRARVVESSATALPPGHVRKKATGEIGKVRSVDAQAGTASVHWLKRGAISTVPLTAISRK
jgi:hypothetical protein